MRASSKSYGLHAYHLPQIRIYILKWKIKGKITIPWPKVLGKDRSHWSSKQILTSLLVFTSKTLYIFLNKTFGFKSQKQQSKSTF